MNSSTLEMLCICHDTDRDYAVTEDECMNNRFAEPALEETHSVALKKKGQTFAKELVRGHTVYVQYI